MSWRAYSAIMVSSMGFLLFGEAAGSAPERGASKQDLRREK